MNDTSLIGTQRLTIRAEVWDDGRIPGEGLPDSVKEIEVFTEADGTEILDPERIDRIRALQHSQSEGS
jgi:hypothetical protein